MRTVLSQALLYAPNAFYCYPWKPLLNEVAGNSYDIGLQHFKDQHATPLNLALHVVALFVQILGNSTFLAHVDAALFPQWPRLPLTACTSVVWAVYLLASPAPAWCKQASLCCLAFAYVSAPYILQHSATFELGMLLAFHAVVALYAASGGTANYRKLPKWLALHFGPVVMYRAIQGAYGGALAAHTLACNAVFLTLMITASAKTAPSELFPVKASTFLGAIFARPFAVLTAQTWPLFYAWGFVGMSLQGASHELSREEATLLKLQGIEESTADKVSYEWSHVVFFPALLFHAIHLAVHGDRQMKKAS